MFTSVAVLAASESSSSKASWLEKLRQALRNPVRFRVREFFSIDEINQGLSSFHFQVLIMRVKSFEDPHVQMLMKVRQRFPHAAIITLCGHIDPSARYKAKEISGHKLLLETHEMKDLAQVIETFVTGHPSAMRLHSRVRREDACEVVTEGDGKASGQFVDFAQMGARLVVSPRALFRKGMQVQLHYPSTTEPGKIHRIAASVRWVQFDSGMVGTIVNGPRQVIGLRFIAAL